MSEVVSGMEFGAGDGVGAGFGQVAAAALQVLSEAVEQETVRRGDRERAGLGAEQSLLTGQVSSWMEQFAGAPLWERRKELGLQLRAELMELLGGMEPQLATAMLCRLPGAERRGYTVERLAVSLGVAQEQIVTWEGEAYARLGELVTERTPFLAFFKMRSGEGAEPVSEPKRNHDTMAELLELARSEAAFDLRKYVGAELELRIRQAFHRLSMEALEQVEALFADDESLAVALVGARMTLETGGEEETNHG